MRARPPAVARPPRRRFGGRLLAWAALLGSLAGCGPRTESIRINGSSTVFPISEAVAEEYANAHAEARVTVGASGTGGGFQKFANGEIDICDASREIRNTEIEACKTMGAEFVRLSVALDGIVVVVNPENDWVDCLAVERLAEIWGPDNPANKWSDLDPEWPDQTIRLYGPGTDSGTFDYFTEVIVGEKGASRADFTASEDDNVLVTGVAKDKFALGYFGFAYYIENADSLKRVGIKNDKGECVVPTVETIRSNEYAPLSRPLFLYVRRDLLARPEGSRFIDFYLDNAGALAEEVGYVAVSDRLQLANRDALTAAGASPRQADAD